MMKLAVMRRSASAIMFGLTLSASGFAGQTCSEVPPRPESVRMAFSSASALSTALDQAQPQVAIIARVGQDLSKYGLLYSHLALVAKDQASGQWRTMHLLNACGTAESAIWKEGLANFFLDDPFRYQSLIVIPSPEAQRKMAAKLADPAQYLALFTPHYNMLAYPFSTKYENSNQWVLELLTKVYADNIEIDTREKSQQWLKLMGYEPTTLTLRPLERMGGRMFRANIAFDDHPNERRFADKIDIVTVDSMTKFLKKIDPATTFTVVPEPQLAPLAN